MERRTYSRYLISYAILGVLSLVFLTAGIGLGSLRLSLDQVFQALVFGRGENAPVIWQIRFPRVLAAYLLGGALSVSGFLLQTFFSNPIASPFVLGISSGARLAVCLVIVGLTAAGRAPGSGTMILAAFAGACASMGFILLISQKVRNMAMLVVCGVMAGDICSAACEIVTAFAQDSDIVSLHQWSVGSFSGITWENLKVMAPVVLAALAGAFLLSKPMGAYQMGESYARNLGVPIRRFRFALIFLSSILSACVAAFAGPISFVGIAVPHLVKSLLGTARPLFMIPGCILGGGVFCLFCDLAARLIFAPTELGISSVTALAGAPVVIYLLISRRGQAR